jgi:hypothetical protein
VRFDIKNDGQTPLAAPWPITARVVDDGGVSHVVQTSVTGLRHGRLLPASRSIGVGRTTSGFLVFQVPAANKISEVRMT